MTAPRSLRWLLVALVAVALVRLIGFAVAFGQESLQMDFAAFYTAGEALNAGLDPYRSHIFRSPPIWDGVDLFQHSRFLYPPLVATLFQPVAWLPYSVAKAAWMVVSLLTLAIALILAMRVAGVRLSDNAAWATWLVALVFHPLLTFLERGQIDSITLLLVTAGIVLLGRRRREGIAGLLFALATLLKLHAVLLVPFLVVQKRWRALASYAAGGVLLLLLSLLLNGPTLLVQYATVEFPRISEFGEWGTDEMRVDPARVAALQPAEGLTTKDGRVYSREYFSFVSNASLGRTQAGYKLQGLLGAMGFGSAQSVAALVTFGVCFGVVVALQWGRCFVDLSQPTAAFLYWQLALVIVLLSAPLTWVMNTIWLLALVPLAIRWGIARRAGAPEPWPRRLGWVLVAFGLVIAMVPDHLAFSLLIPAGAAGEAAQQKYVIAELAVALGLVLCLLRHRPHRAPRRRRL
ncbi:MAG: DUF2029 domain-containing protein [Anaerolineae bacterium]|nr:DUF2029 domain-containing protein [Anaerolineae bacterium]